MEPRLIIAVVMILFILPTAAHAETSVNISGNGENSRSSVSVTNSVSSSTNQSSQAESRTDIRIETNGNVKTYHSDKPNENIRIESDDGTARVNVKNETGNTTIVTPPPQPTHPPKPEVKRPVQGSRQEAVNTIRQYLRNLFLRFRELSFRPDNH